MRRPSFPAHNRTQFDRATWARAWRIARMRAKRERSGNPTWRTHQGRAVWVAGLRLIERGTPDSLLLPLPTRQLARALIREVMAEPVAHEKPNGASA